MFNLIFYRQEKGTFRVKIDRKYTIGLLDRGDNSVFAMEFDVDEKDFLEKNLEFIKDAFDLEEIQEFTDT